MCLTVTVSPPQQHLPLAQASLNQAIAHHQQYLETNLPSDLTPQLQEELDRLTQIQTKLQAQIVRIAVFGLVSRGKSAVLNALMGEKLLETGPLNGVTLEPQVVLWSPDSDGVQNVELVDTPGLDEISGQERAQMAQTVADQADLILFVISGDVTVVEYQALCDLKKAQKPMILAFNKIDLYPEQTRAAIYANLLQLGEGENLLTESDIVLIAAAPTPEQVRVEREGQVDYIWEAQPPMIDELENAILSLLNREGRSLLALNALTQAQKIEVRRRELIVTARATEAEALIWQYTRAKAIAVGFNPFWLVDMVGGVVSDLAMIRSLAKLYGLPMTSHAAGDLLRTILFSSGALLGTQLFGGIVMGFGKALEPTGPGAFSVVGLLQGAAAGWGSYQVGQVAQVYLAQGCSWGEVGPSTVIRQILSQVDQGTVLHRLRQELQV